MGFWEFTILVAFGIILFIVIRRLPQTRERDVATGMKNKTGMSQLEVKNIFKGGINFSFLQRYVNNIFMLTRRKKSSINSEQILKQSLKKKEDRDFWIDEEKKAKPDVISKTYFEEAEKAFKSQDYRKAEAMYLEAAKENIKNPKIFSRLGAIYLEQKDFDYAVEAFKTALKLDDEVSSRHYNLALAYVGQGSYKEAKSHLERAIKLSPTNDKYHEVLEKINKK